MRPGKLPEQMTRADYTLAFRRAVYERALPGAKLTDEEVKSADKALMDSGLYATGYNLHGTMESLRDLQKHHGDTMPVSAGRQNLEYANRAAQAVVQYREYKAAQSDANRERARNEVNQMFADQARVVWNSAVNIVEGTINTMLDAGATNGGMNPLPLLNPNRPQVDFSSVKTDYRSEMMRRDLNGKLDSDGIKAGQFIETGVTIAAPLVVGAATTPKAAPQSLKSLGGIPEVETSATTTAQTVNKVGKLEIEQGRILSPSEQRFADKMAAEGKNVKAPKEVNQQNVKNPDFHIDNEIVEFKYVSDLKGTNADKLSGGLSRRILDGGSQASKVSLDVTNQAGMTKEIAQRAISRTFGRQTQLLRLGEISKPKIIEVRIYGKGFDLTIPYKIE